MVLILLITTIGFAALQIMHTNACRIANAQAVEYGPAVGVKLLSATMAKYILLQQLPYLTEGLLLHGYLPIICP